MLDRFRARGGNYRERLDDSHRRMQLRRFSVEDLVKAARAAEVVITMQKNKLAQLEAELVKRGQAFQRRPSPSDNGQATPEQKRPRGRPRKSDELEQTRALSVVKIEVNQTFALKDAANAHRALAGRETTGSTILLP